MWRAKSGDRPTLLHASRASDVHQYWYTLFSLVRLSGHVTLSRYTATSRDPFTPFKPCPATAAPPPPGASARSTMMNGRLAVAIGHLLGVHWRMLTSKRVVRCLARRHSTTAFACEDAMHVRSFAPRTFLPTLVSSSTFPNSHSAPVLVSRAIRLDSSSSVSPAAYPDTHYPRSSLASCHRPSLRSVVLHTRPAVLPHHQQRQPCHFHTLNLSTAYQFDSSGHFSHGLTTIVAHSNLPPISSSDLT
jgi:hypothetical protein